MGNDAAAGILKYRCVGTIRCLPQLVWKDKSRLPRILRGYATPEEARIALAQAADTLGLSLCQNALER